MELLDGRLGAVDLIPRHRMPDGGQVYPYLMGPPCLQLQPEVGKGSHPFQHLIMSDRLPRPLAGTGDHAHLLPVGFVPPDGRVDGPAVLGKAAVGDSLIPPLEGVDLNLFRQPQVGGVGFLDRKITRLNTSH